MVGLGKYFLVLLFVVAYPSDCYLTRYFHFRLAADSVGVYYYADLSGLRTVHNF